MQINTIKMTILQNMYWVTSFHQLCTSMLNMNNLTTTSQVNSTNSSSNGGNNTIYNATDSNPEVIQAISFFMDNIGSYCDSISSWGNDQNREYINQLQWILINFNSGISGPSLCSDSYKTTGTSSPVNSDGQSSPTSSFYYYESPDLIIIPQFTVQPTPPSSNTSTPGNITSPPTSMNILNGGRVLFSLLENTYLFRTFSIVAILLAYGLIIPILFSIMLCSRNRKKSWMCCNPSKLSTRSTLYHVTPSITEEKVIHM